MCSVLVDEEDDWEALLSVSHPAQTTTLPIVDVSTVEIVHTSREYVQALPKRPQVFKAVRGDQPDPDPPGAMLVQTYQAWRPAARSLEASLFPHMPPRAVGVSCIAPWRAMRTCVRRWEVVGPSDVGGCVEYRAAGFLGPTDLDSLPDDALVAVSL